MIPQILSVLPDVEAKTFKKKRLVSDPNISTLTAQQKLAFDSILNFIQDPTSSMYLLQGYAGTGKSFVISRLVEYILYHGVRPKSTGLVLDNDVLHVCMSAPTNKAVKVLYGMSEFTHPELSFSTIHSLLGLRPKIDIDGNQIFVQNTQIKTLPIESVDLLILDEVSMLQDELFELLLDYVEKGLKVLFVGDPAQIPPVNKLDCKPFLPDTQELYEIEKSELTSIVRQAESNPIIGLTLKVRQALLRPIVLPVKTSSFDEESGEGAYFFDFKNNRKPIYRLMRHYYKSANFAADSDFVKILAWTNKTVNFFNTAIRTMLYGKESPDLVVGEKLIANAPILESSEDSPIPRTLFSTNDEFTVVDLEEETQQIFRADFKVYIATCSMEVAGEQIKHEIRIIHEDSYRTYATMLESLSELAKAEGRGTYQAAKRWKDFYAFKEFFADVSYAYALTVHKSQGSTFSNVFVIDPDIDQNRKIEERNRIKYVAYSRASHALMILN